MILRPAGILLLAFFGRHLNGASAPLLDRPAADVNADIGLGDHQGQARGANGTSADKAGRAGKPGEEDELGNSLRKYLYEKYVYRNNNGGLRSPVELE